MLPTVSSPILVTGSHRSGTTWTGTLLALSGEALPIHEPFNPVYPRSWLRNPPTRWFDYVESDEADPLRSDLEAMVELRPPIGAMLRRSAGIRHWARVAQDAFEAADGRRRGKRPLLKDPIAFFSAPWIASAVDASVVVLVRHPAAFASSLKRLDWQFDFRNLADQPKLMEEVLGAHADEIVAAVDRQLDIIDTSILLWRVINSVALTYRDRYPDWHVVRYEDLAADPLRGFEQLYAALGLRWEPGVAAAVTAHTKSGNEVAPAEGDRGGVVRDSSRAMWTWTDRLTASEIDRVRVGTADVADLFYGPVDWAEPTGP